MATIKVTIRKIENSFKVEVDVDVEVTFLVELK